MADDGDHGGVAARVVFRLGRNQISRARMASVSRARRPGAEGVRLEGARRLGPQLDLRSLPIAVRAARRDAFASRAWPAVDADEALGPRNDDYRGRRDPRRRVL